MEAVLCVILLANVPVLLGIVPSAEGIGTLAGGYLPCCTVLYYGI